MGKCLGPSAGEVSAASQKPLQTSLGNCLHRDSHVPMEGTAQGGVARRLDAPLRLPLELSEVLLKGTPPPLAPPLPCSGARALGGPLSRLLVAGVPPLPTPHRTVPPGPSAPLSGRGDNEKICSPYSKTPHTRAPRPPAPPTSPFQLPARPSEPPSPEQLWQGRWGALTHQSLLCFSILLWQPRGGL